MIEELAAPAAEAWDARTVHAPGGHVLQSFAWAEQCRADGWIPRFLAWDDGRAALALTHRLPPLPGVSVYLSRGPVPGDDPPGRLAGRIVEAGAWLAARGAMVVAADPEVGEDPAYGTALMAGGFRPTEEIQPARHRMRLPLPSGADETGVWAGVARSTRQRIEGARRAGLVVREDAEGTWLARFGELLGETAERRAFSFSRSFFLAWWRRALAAGLARFLVVEADGRLLGGLYLYRHGGRYSTAHSADDADARRERPGVMHLLRWEAIRLAIAEGAPELDLGGVDVAGARRPPRPGEPMYGLYEHKRSFGAEWVEQAGAHELVARPWLYRLALAGRAVRRTLRPAGRGTL